MTTFLKNFQRRRTVNIEEELLRPYYTLVTQGRGNESLSEQIPNAFQYWLKIPEEKLQIIKDFMKMYYYYIILFDDIQDSSLQRGTALAADCVLGLPLTLNSVHYVLGLCMEKILKLGHPQAMEIFRKQHLELLRGQGEDVYIRENLVHPTEEHFTRIAKKKSSEMFRLIFSLMSLFSDNTINVNELITKFGIYYHIRNDYCNLMKSERERLEGQQRARVVKCLSDKDFCQDMTDGKYSFPVVHAIKHPEGQILKYILKQHSRDISMKVYYKSLLEKLGSVEYTCAVLERYDHEIREELVRLGGNPIMKDLLDDFKVWKK